ncbi:hypothetical protein Tco_0033334 [Tanacetum coccineum]
MPHESPLHSVHSLGRDEGSLSLNELTVLCTSLSKKVASLESELKQIKETYSTALTNLILRVKKLEKQVFTEAAKQGRGVGLTQTYTRRRRNVGTGSGGVSTASESDSTAGGKAKEEGSTDEREDSFQLKATQATQATQEHDIDWNDPSVLRYHAQLNRPYSVAEVRKNMIMYLKNQGGYKMRYFKGMKYEYIGPIFEQVWDQTQSFMPMDSEKESKEKAKEKMKRKTSKAREDKIKRQKTKDDPEKLILMEYVQVVSDSEEAINVIPLAVKSPIVSWKSYCKGDMGFYEIHKADGNYKTYKFFSEMLKDLVLLLKIEEYKLSH